MDFSKLRHRVIFLKPLDKRLNSMNENVPVWIPFKPKLSGDINAVETSVYVLTDNKGNAVWKSAGGGQLYSHQLSLNEYAVWANVSPMLGREYEESQKLRAETTYKITTRYFPNITAPTHIHKIMFGLKVLDIVSVLNIGENNTELQIVAKEKDRNGKEY